MEETLFSFGKTCDSTGAEEMWCVIESSDLDERQFTAHLTIFADGSVLPPLLIFIGKCISILIEEKRR